MPHPVATHSSTVHLGTASPHIHYLSPFLPNSTYTFYRGTTRYMLLWSNYVLTFPEETFGRPAIFKSVDEGETWTGPLDPDNAPVLDKNFLQGSPCYDYRFAAAGDVGINPALASSVTAMFKTAVSLEWDFADFAFSGESWGAPYGTVTGVGGGSAFHFASAPNGNRVYAIQTATPTVVGAPTVGTAPELAVDASSDAHYGADGGTPGFSLTENSGNVRIHNGKLYFPRIKAGVLEVLSRPLGSSTWTAETVGSVSNPDRSTRVPWLYNPRTVYWIDTTSYDKVYRSKKSGTWGDPVQVWSFADDTNPDLGDNLGINSLCVSRNPVVGGVDISFHCDGFFEGYGEAVLTFNSPLSEAANRYYGA